jgi:hypothetical protein
MVRRLSPWNAKATGNGGAAAMGSDTFRLELRDHILARHGDLSRCKEPSDFDCDHGDFLYIYRELASATSESHLL